MDFAEDRLMSGRKLTALLVKDEATSFGLSLTMQRSFKAVDVERVLDQLAEKYGAPRYMRSDNGGQLIAYVVQRWAHRRNITLAYIDPGKPWQTGFAERFVGTFRREVLDAEVFMSLQEAHIFSNQWLTMYNTERPHSKHNYRPPITAFNNKAA
ncbi:MAG: transposase family protein [Ignavibacteria bacterium]|nr:transposase family protein [Ignavibacteria bacterium]